MKTFLQKHAAKVTGFLSGFDRVVFRGSLRYLSRSEGMEQYLNRNDVLLKNFNTHVLAVTERLKKASLSAAKAQGRPVIYLASAKASKEAIARKIMQEDGIETGLIGVLKCVEPCQTFEIHRNRAKKTVDLTVRIRKCNFFYHYWNDPKLGFMHARIQTWFPFPIQVCINGREWLARRLTREGIAYLRQDNCFPWLEDPQRAQALMDAQLNTDWPRWLGRVARQLNPIHDEIFSLFPQSYYWTVYQSEWATDVMFKKAGELTALYSRLLRHGMTTFDSPAVMRFLGRKIPATGRVHGRFMGEVLTDLQTRPEGVRIKHYVHGNSIKMYNKQGCILRVETTINHPNDFRVYRPKEGGAKEDLAWRSLRRGVSDTRRRAMVSQAANARYLEALSAVEQDQPLGQWLAKICQPAIWHSRRFRGLNPFGEDVALLSTLMRGEFAINGFRNRDLRAILFPPTKNRAQIRRQSGRVTRLLRLLRAHRLIRKVPSTHRYLPTAAGRKILVALSSAKQANMEKLAAAAA